MTSVSRDERAEPANERDQFIPVRKADILDALVEHGTFGSEDERDEFRQICRLLAAIYHYEYFDELERLRHAYFYFNPELEPPARIDDATLERALRRSRRSARPRCSRAPISSKCPMPKSKRRTATRKVMRVEVEAPVDDFREVRFFRRGHHTETIETSEWFGLRKRDRTTSSSMTTSCCSWR